LLFFPIYSLKAEPSNTRRIRRTSQGNLRGVYRFLFTNFSFLLIYKPNPRRVPRVAGVVDTSTYPSFPYTAERQRHASQTAKLDLAPRQSQSPLPIYYSVHCLPCSMWVFTRLFWVFTRLFSRNITRACGVNSHAPFTHPQTKPRALNTAYTPPKPSNKSKKLELSG
jgi:hypothetical protein